MARLGPTYNLESVQAEVRAGRYRLTQVAFDGAIALGLDRTDIEECVCNLDLGDFYKTMPSNRRQGAMQDVYRPTYDGTPIYLKLQYEGTAWVISFKRDESR